MMSMASDVGCSPLIASRRVIWSSRPKPMRKLSVICSRTSILGQKWLVLARNAMAHLDTGEFEAKVPEEARYRLTYVTRALLHLIILAELGVSSDIHRAVVREEWRYSAARFAEMIRAAS